MRFAPYLLIFLTATILFSQNRGFKIVDNEGKEKGSFGVSWALIIGINDYKEGEIPKLKHAVNDAVGIKELLTQFQGFENEKVLTLLNSNASKDNIIESFEFLKKNVTTEDRIVVFFAGHGITMSTPGGREKGYILPVDAKTTEYAATCLSVDQLNEWSEQINAKHIYFVMDACYGGTIFTRANSLSANAQEYYDIVTSRVARQAITAGGRDQQVLDIGNENHSVFTYHFISGIRDGLADLNGDGIITASEIASYVAPNVSASSKNQQTPEYGSVAGSQGGEFVFLAPKTSFKKIPFGAEKNNISFNDMLENENKMSISIERVFSTETAYQIGFKYPFNVQKLTKKSIVFFLIPNIYGLYVGTINSIEFSKSENWSTGGPSGTLHFHYNYKVIYIKGELLYEIVDLKEFQIFANIGLLMFNSMSGQTEIQGFEVGQTTFVRKELKTSTKGGGPLLSSGVNVRYRIGVVAISADWSYVFNKPTYYLHSIGEGPSINPSFYDNWQDHTNHNNINYTLGIEFLF